MYLSFMGSSAVIFTLASLTVLCVSSTSSSSSSSSLNEDGSLHLAPVKRGIDPVGSWLLKRRIAGSPSSSSSSNYGSQGLQNWPAAAEGRGTGAELGARRISQDENEFAEEEVEEDAGEEGPTKRRIDPVGSYLLRKRVIDPVGSYLLKKKSDEGYGSLQSGANE